MYWIFLLILLISAITFKVSSIFSVMSLNQKLNKIIDFNPSDTINGINNLYLFAVDNNSEKICYLDKDNKEVISFSDIVSIEMIEDGISIFKKSITETETDHSISYEERYKNKLNASIITLIIKYQNKKKSRFKINCFDSEIMTFKGEKNISINSSKYQIGKQNSEEIKEIIFNIMHKRNLL